MVEDCSGDEMFEMHRSIRTVSVFKAFVLDGRMITETTRSLSKNAKIAQQLAVGRMRRPAVKVLFR